jgi:GNAT superfamily N-acetyltransferase
MQCGQLAKVRVIEREEMPAIIPALADLRIRVFREYPYLYDGDAEYERAYLSAYEMSDQAIIVGAFDGERLVGAATGTPLGDHHDEFAGAFASSDLDLSRIFYCAESVLLPEYRGQGIGHQFFDEREAHARRLGFTHCCFCAVERGETHPVRPADYSPLDAFWRGRDYRRLEGITARFEWKDTGALEASAKTMQFWMRTL